MPTYDACKSLYVTLKYPAKTTSVWTPELWQTGFHLLVDSSTSPKPLDSGRVTPSNFSVDDASVSRSAGGWDIDAGWVGSGGVGTISDADVDAILALIRSWTVSMRPQLSNQYNLPQVRMYPMLAGTATPVKAGLSATAPVIAQATDSAMGPTGASALPPEVSMAVSLQTGTRGPSGRGRLFIGSLATTVAAATGLISSAEATNFANWTKTLLNGIRDINNGSLVDEAQFTPVIYTKVPNKSGQNQDTGSVINSIRVSDEFDVQRRRQHQRPDTYVAVAL